MKTKTIIYISIGVIILLGIALYIGKTIGSKDQKDQETRTKIEYIQVDNKKAEKKVDSLKTVIKYLDKKDSELKEKEIEYREVVKQIIIEKPENPECNDLYNSASEKISNLKQLITVKDSVEYNLRSVIRNKDGIIVEKDRIIQNKDQEIKLTQELNKPRKKRFVVGVHVGTGYGVTSNQNNINLGYVPVQVSVGLTYKIFEF